MIGAAFNFFRRLAYATKLEKPAKALLYRYMNARPERVVTRNGLTYKLDLREVIDRSIYMGGWESQTIDFLRSTVRMGSTVVEIGANIGAHTLMLAELAGPTGRVLAFEPTTYAQSKLRANIALNPHLKDRIRIYSELVTNHAGAVPRRLIQSGFPFEGKASAEIVESPAVALDEFLELERLDLLKVDVDGYDFKVLSGATGLLKAFKPKVLIELCEYALAAQGDSVRSIFELMDSLGYNSYREDGRRIANADEVLAQIGNHTGINAVFR